MELPTLPNPSRKKLIIILSGLGIFLLVIMAFLMSMDPANKKSGAPIDNSNNTADNNQQPQPSTEASSAPAGWTSYKNIIFKINYPKGWTTEEVRFTDGETGMSFHPAVKTPNNPSMMVVNITSGSKTAIQEEQNYLNLGFSKSTVLVNKQQAIQLKGTIPPKSASTSGKNLIQVSHIYVQNGANEYLLKSTYVDKTENLVLQDTFNKMISSFTFIQPQAQ